jgi:hypothetical protein
MTAAFYYEGKNKKTISELIGSKPETIQAWIDSFEKGKTFSGKWEKQFVNKKMSDEEMVTCFGAVLESLASKGEMNNNNKVVVEATLQEEKNGKEEEEVDVEEEEEEEKESSEDDKKKKKKSTKK